MCKLRKGVEKINEGRNRKEEKGKERESMMGRYGWNDNSMGKEDRNENRIEGKYIQKGMRKRYEEKEKGKEAEEGKTN